MIKHHTIRFELKNELVLKLHYGIYHTAEKMASAPKNENASGSRCGTERP